MKKTFIGFTIMIFIVSLSVFTYGNSKNKNYSDDFSFERANEIIAQVKEDDYLDDFAAWDLQKIDDDLLLVSYSDQVIEDVYQSEHSWIMQANEILYEVKAGKLISGEELYLNIASKFKHNIKTFSQEVLEEDIDF